MIHLPGTCKAQANKLVSTKWHIGQFLNPKSAHINTAPLQAIHKQSCFLVTMLSGKLSCNSHKKAYVVQVKARDASYRHE